MSSKQIALLSQANFLQRRLRRMPRQILKYVAESLADNPALTEEQLLEAVILWQTLDPLRLGPLKSISLDIDLSWFTSIYGVQFTAYRADAVVPYDGSPELWSARLSNEFKSDMCGIVQRHTLRVITTHDSKNWTQVEDLMLNWLTHVHHALPEFEHKIMMYNLRLRERVTPAVHQSIEIARAKAPRR